MTSIVFFIEQIAFGLYILSAGGILFMAYRLQHARRELNISQFKLEREHAQVRQANAITFGGLMIELVVAVWAVANMMAPTVRDIRLGSQDAVGAGVQRFVTSTPAANPPIALGGSGSGDQGPAIFQTPVSTATPVGTILPDAPDIVGCPRDSAWFLIPSNGQRIFEATTAWGTANVSNFSSYRFEIKAAQGDAQFAPIGGDYTTPVIDGPLGDIFPRNFPTGEYRFRLVVFDNTNTVKALCEVTIHISEPPPTPTPIGPAAPTQPPQ